MPTLAQRVFQVIADRYMQRATDIALFAKTGIAFEEWLSWEAFAACQKVKRWHTKPRPRYPKSNVRVPGFGNLWVEESEEHVLAEIRLVHDGTTEQWQPNLDGSMAKLARALNRGVPLQIMVLASRFQMDGAKVLGRRLTKVESWDKPAPLTASVRLRDGGQMLIRGWEGVGDHSVSLSPP